MESKQRKHFLENAESALSWIGTATSLPAARLESWGLVTLAFADNGSLRVVQDPSGTSYRATFYARHFTLVIRQESLNAPAVAHITPHPHPLPTTEVPGLDWKVLLETGSSIKTDDDLLAWPDNSNAKLKPPTSLLDGTWENNLKRIISDYHFTKDMEMQLRRAIFRCYDTWEFALESHPEDGFIRQYATRIMQNLRKFKVFTDCRGCRDRGWRDYCGEITESDDVLHYSWRMSEILNSHPMAKAGFSENHTLQTVVEQHNLIASLLKLLLLPVRIPNQLSTRGTGEMLLLA